jgi:predicted PurR-regulated permease PerM
VLPEVTARLDADVEGFIRAWERAADAAQRAAARIRAAQASVGDIDIDASRFGELNGELERLTRTVRQAADQIREFGNSTREASGGVRSLGDAARDAGNSFGGSGGGGLGGGLMKAGAQMKVMLAAAALVASVLPAIAAAAIAAGAAFQAMSVVGAVVIAGWKGIEQAGERLKNSLRGLQSQLESVFRSELSGEFQKLGQAIAQLDGPLKGIARSVSDVVKEFTGWIRSSEGMREIETMLGGVDNMVKSLAPGAKALAQAFTGFGEAAAPALDDIGKALSSVFENLNNVIQRAKDTGQLEKAFKAGASAIEAFGEVLAGVIEILIEMAASGGEPASEAIKKFGQAMKDAAPAIGVMFGHLARLMNIIATVVGWLGKLLKATEPLARAVQKAGDEFDKFIKNGEGFKKLGALVVAAFEVIKKAITDGVNKAVQAVKDWWNKTVQDVKQGVQKVVQDIKDWWNKNVQEVKTGTQKVIQAIKDWWNKTVEDVKSGAQKAVEAVVEWWRNTIQAIKDGINEWLESIKEWWDNTVEGVKAGVDKAVEAVKQLPQKAKQELDKWINDMKQAGKDAGDGLAQGLGQAISNVVSVATRMAQAAMTAIKSTLGIRSPSVVLREEVGMMMGAGIAEGIIASAGLVTDAMRRTGLGALAAGRAGAALSGASLARGGGQTFTIQVLGGADSAAGTFIARLAQQGKLKITANAVVR